MQRKNGCITNKQKRALEGKHFGEIPNPLVDNPSLFSGAFSDINCFVNLDSLLRSSKFHFGSILAIKSSQCEFGLQF
jgi:hypothetical protein